MPLTNADSSIQLTIDGADSDAISNYADSPPGEGLTNNALQPVKIDTSVKSRRRTSRPLTQSDPGTAYIVVTTGHNRNSAVQQAIQVYLGRGAAGDTIIVTCYESGVDSAEYRGVAVLNDYTSTSAIDAVRGAPGETLVVLGVYDNTKSSTAPIYTNHIPAVTLAEMQFPDGAIVVPNFKFRIKTVFTDKNGGTDITRVYARISTATETIQYYTRALRPIPRRSPSRGPIRSITLRSIPASWEIPSLAWTFNVKWIFVEPNNYAFSARVTDDKRHERMDGYDLRAQVRERSQIFRYARGERRNQRHPGHQRLGSVQRNLHLYRSYRRVRRHVDLPDSTNFNIRIVQFRQRNIHADTSARARHRHQTLNSALRPTRSDSPS